MADQSYRRGSRDRNDRDRYDRDRRYSRQAEQFDTTDRGWLNEERNYSQFGDAWRDEDQGWSGQTDPSYGRGWNQPSESEGEFRRHGRGRHRDMAGDEFGGRQFGRATAYGAGSQLAAARGEWRERPDWNERNERGWFDKASDEVASWFGDEAATRRRELYDHRGHGPAGYKRSDDRILEDASDALTDDWHVDARKVQITVSNGEVTLEGTVPSRQQKRRAEDCVEDLSGVRHVQNNLRVEESPSWDRNNSSDTISS
ncbi:BON domain-containing protein [Croceibacterium selenioxidans]|nr:BON domain-containing protein [Croceibacterium selenioxidans]